MLMQALHDCRNFGSGLTSRLRLFVRGRDGVAIVDFALVVPILVFLLLGSMEIGRYVLLNQKLSRVAISSSDLMSQAKHAVVDDINQIFAAAQYTMNPFELGADGVVFLTSVSTDSDLPIEPEISWQMSGGGTGIFTSEVGTGVGTPATLPGGFTMEENQNIIIAEVYYSYQPFFFSKVIQPKTIRQIGLHYPRLRPLRELVTP